MHHLPENDRPHSWFPAMALVGGGVLLAAGFGYVARTSSQRTARGLPRDPHTDAVASGAPGSSRPSL